MKTLIAFMISIFIVGMSIHPCVSFAEDKFIFNYPINNDQTYFDALQAFSNFTDPEQAQEVLPLLRKRNPNLEINSLNSKVGNTKNLWLEIPKEHLDPEKVKSFFYSQASIPTRSTSSTNQTNPKSLANAENKQNPANQADQANPKSTTKLPPKNAANEDIPPKLLLGFGPTNEILLLDHDEYTTEATKEPYNVKIGYEGKNELYNIHYQKSIFIKGPSFKDYQLSLNYNIKKFHSRLAGINVKGSYTNLDRTIFYGEIDSISKTLALNAHFAGFSLELYDFSNLKLLAPTTLGLKVLTPINSKVSGDSTIKLEEGSYIQTYFAYQLHNNISLKGTYTQFKYKSQLTSNNFIGSINYIWKL